MRGCMCGCECAIPHRPLYISYLLQYDMRQVIWDVIG